MMLRFAFYRVRPDADMDAFRAFEARVGEPYGANCREFGFHSLGTYEVVGDAPHIGTCTHADVYAVPGHDPDEAEARAAEAPSTPEFDAIVDECQSFMAPDARHTFWFTGAGGQPDGPVSFGPRTIVVDLTASRPDAVLGRYDAVAFDGVEQVSVDVVEPEAVRAPSAGWCLRPVGMGLGTLAHLD